MYVVPPLSKIEMNYIKTRYNYVKNEQTGLKIRLHDFWLKEIYEELQSVTIFPRFLSQGDFLLFGRFSCNTILISPLGNKNQIKTLEMKGKVEWGVLLNQRIRALFSDLINRIIASSHNYGDIFSDTLRFPLL